MKQAQALELLKTGRNIFVTGPAGSGKTFLINSYIKFLKENNVDVGITASTGIAATHIGGVTIHSWSGIGIKTSISDSDMEDIYTRSYLIKRFESVKVLIIDEISMLHHFRLDLVDQVLRAMKDAREPFGGIQVVLCGDFFQLPPVTRYDEPQSDFVYKSEAWQNTGFTICYLEEQYRQKDDVVMKILNEIREGFVTDKSKEILNSRLNKKTTNIEPTKLFTHNEDVDQINHTELDKISGVKQVEYEMETKGRPLLVESLKKSCLAPEILRLKVGARVMCVKNNFDVGYVNGSLGVVVSCKTDMDPVIRLVNGKIVSIERASWKIEEDGSVKAELKQYPLRLAWAITVHKSQGMSLDAVEVDLSKSFEPGMGYVALSRVRTLEGLTILGMNNKALEINLNVLDFDDKLRESGKLVYKRFFSEDSPPIIELQKDFLEYIKPKVEIEELPSHEQTGLLIEKRMSVKDIVKIRNIKPETVVDHIEKLLLENNRMDIGYFQKEISKTHWIKISKVFDKIIDAGNEIHLSTTKNILGANISYYEIRLARAIKGLVPVKK